jgi:MFS family permease
MIGMLVGGIFWGILADKKGRLSVLFGSILMYSLANIGNGLIAHVHTSVDQIILIYSALRFIAGVGLAGELGAGITLVSEIMSKETRGFGTMIVASVGVTGAVVAGLVGKMGWEVTYYIGGGLGISLLLLRIGVFESGIFKNIQEKEVGRGNFFALFKDKKKGIKYLNCILIGLPVWFIIGILIARAPEISKILKVQGNIDQGLSVILCYSGLIFGDLTSGVISQVLKSRKKVFYIFYIICILLVVAYLNLKEVPSIYFYSGIFLLGFSVGFWAVFVTVGSEQFGTNLRGTVATTVPNFVRGSLVPIAFLFDFINGKTNVITAGYIVTTIIMVISFISLYFLEETFGKDLDYVEEDLIP